MSTTNETSMIDSTVEQLMKLPPEQRLEIGERLLDSVPMFPDKESEEKLAETVERRWKEIVEGQVKTIPGDEVFRRIREKLDERDKQRNAQ